MQKVFLPGHNMKQEGILKHFHSQSSSLISIKKSYSIPQQQQKKGQDTGA